MDRIQDIGAALLAPHVAGTDLPAGDVVEQGRVATSGAEGECGHGGMMSAMGEYDDEYWTARRRECQHLWVASMDRPLSPGWLVFYCTAGCKARTEVVEAFVPQFLEGHEPPADTIAR